ncbi:MAG: tetratricopeptide repeat protein [bacterium]|nr:tetratricopeptide repeat protein [bacterium]
MKPLAPQMMGTVPQPDGVLYRRRNMSQFTALEHRRAGPLSSPVALFLCPVLWTILAGCAPESPTGRGIDELASLVRDNPDDPELRFRFGMAFLAEEPLDWEQAGIQFGRAAELAPTFTEAHFNYGICLARTERYPEAEKAFRLTISLDPNFAPAWINLGVIHQINHRFDEARDAFQRAAKLDPSSYEAAFNLGCARDNMRDLPGAVEAYEAAIKLRPDLPHAYGNVARLYYLAGRYSDAVARLETALKLQPDTPAIYYDLYQCHRELGDIAKSEEYYKTAITIDPRYAEIYGESREFVTLPQELMMTTPHPEEGKDEN